MKKNIISCLFLLSLSASLFANEYLVKQVEEDFSKKPNVHSKVWTDIKEINIFLMGQLMVKPKTMKPETSSVKVQILHDGKFVAFRMRWSDPEKSEAGKLGEFSDALALQFPVKDNAVPPPIFMGGKDNPVHIFHWKAQYQYDEEFGKKKMRDIYPNMSVDIYPMEFPDHGNIKGLDAEKQEVFSPGRAVGNPQAYPKKAVDELFAEGFGTSAVIEGKDSVGHAEYKDGEWTLVISRALKRENGSVLEVGKGSFFGIAVWQGGSGETGGRKSLTMIWTPFKIEGK